MEICEKNFNKQENKQIFSQLYSIASELIKDLKVQLEAKDEQIQRSQKQLSSLTFELKQLKIKFDESSQQQRNQIVHLNNLHREKLEEMNANEQIYRKIIQSLESKGIDLSTLQEEKSNSSISIDANPDLEQTKSMKPAGLSLNLQGLGSAKIKGYHDEVYAKINEFSESWRQQALAEKRF